MTTVDTAVSSHMAPLVGREARRLARHPALWLVPAVVIVTSAVDTASGGRTAGYWYGTIFIAVAFFGPMFVLFAANLVASSARRSRAEEMLNVTPTTDTRRTWAMSLGVALPLAGAGAIGAGAMALIDSVTTIPPKDLLTAAELAQIPPVLAGAGLLGVLTARWLPFAGGVLITFVVATLGGIVLFGRFDSGIWWMWWTTETTIGERAPAAVPGDPWLHVAYLAGLCACAAVAAVYRDRAQWPRLALVGGPVLAATLTLGWLQLS
ncbi:hypothetical protein [Actinocrispum wychmicini]|uniref:ABC-2 type transport system permease protein n=1 Tax=Actinocrispum wychmicini TaxID=1213861 RepID=A0A4R2JRM6_9PSEU|nr:hypothetical protein [Actinocrispum wychmicini]TCO59509.1 hypothetical protein EV192_104351 [Actinocrispum wychmicini]